MPNDCQFILNSSATAMNNADKLLRAIVADMATDAWADKRYVREIIEVRRELQHCGDLARAVARDIHNQRRREQVATGAGSLREIA